MLLLLAVVVSTSVSAAALVAISTITAAVPTVVLLGWVIFESLVLLLHIVEQIFAEFLCLLNIVGIRST